jgi:hypothetical protein
MNTVPLSTKQNKIKVQRNTLNNWWYTDYITPYGVHTYNYNNPQFISVNEMQASGLNLTSNDGQVESYAS